MEGLVTVKVYVLGVKGLVEHLVNEVEGLVTIDGVFVVMGLLEGCLILVEVVYGVFYVIFVFSLFFGLNY